MRRLHQKFLVLVIAFLFLGIHFIRAQYGNEWIDYSRTYYKFKIGKEGIYRIPQSALAASGLSSITGDQVTVFHKGQEIPIFVSTAGTFSSSDFIEFYAHKADGEIDGELYLNPDFHQTTEYSVITDTASYYLAVYPGSHPRITSGTFTLPSTLPDPEPYMITEAISNNGYRPASFGPGRSISSTDNVYKSSFDRGEGYILNVSNATSKISNNNISITKLYTASSVPGSVEIAYTNRQRFAGEPQFKVNSTLLKDTTIIGFGVIKRIFPISSSVLTATTNVNSKDLESRGGFNLIRITYPRTFSYSGLSSTFTKFSLGASTFDRYLHFTDVGSMAENVFLYDLTQNKRYSGNNSSSSSTQYYLPPSGISRTFVFINSSEIQTISSLTPLTFTNYSISSKQGDYIILTHKGYIEDASDPIGQYAAFRSGTGGGGHQVTIVDVTELYDQFGWGYDYHPASIKRFLQYAKETWSTKPEFVFIIGKGLLYSLYPAYLSNPSSYSFSNIVPTFGHPGSDNLLADFNNDNKPDLAIGRLSAWNVQEIHNYLEKVKAYENEMNSAGIPDLENTLWKKRGLFIAGSNESDQASFILPAYTTCENIYIDSFTGGFVTTIKKDLSGLVPEETDNEKIKSLFQSGINRLTFYGHAFSTGFDYNLNNPDELICNPRFPNFIAMGCDVSRIFENNHTISEKFLNSEMGGSISIIASNTLGYPYHLSPYLINYYKTLSYTHFGNTIGAQYMENIASIGESTNDLRIVHLQNILFQGDPGLSTFSPESPDFYTDNNLITSSVNPLNTGTDSAIITTVVYNLGKATEDSIDITIQHQKPDGTILYLADTQRVVIKNVDTFKFIVHFDNVADIGQNILTVKVNPSSEISEISHAQNVAVLNLFMSADVLLPIYPYEYAIVHSLPITLKASALNVFKDNQDFIVQIDTTELFNSPLKQQTVVHNSIGGVVSWQPGITAVDSQVYYWRAAVGGAETDSTLWSNSSFVYLTNGSDGWNQSHYYQFKKDEPYHNMELEDTAKDFRFGQMPNEVLVFNRVYSDANPNAADVRTLINNVEIAKLGCDFNGTIKFILIDPVTAQPVPNSGGDYLSIPPCFSGTRNIKQFEYSLKTAASRKRAADFIDSIPDGHYVIVTNFLYDEGGFWTGTVVDDWAGDVSLYGETSTLYYKLKQLGFEQIDSFNRKRVFTFITKKNDPSFENITQISVEPEELLAASFNIYSRAKKGSVSSVIVGPSRKWKTLLWDINHPSGLPENDTDYVEIYGITNSGSDSLLIKTDQKNVDLLDIDPDKFKNLKLKWHTSDSINLTSSNLRYWRVLHDPVPEAALNPIHHYVRAADTIYEGQKLSFEVNVDNISHVAFEDSMLVHYVLNKKDGTSELIYSERLKKLSGSDSAITKISFDPRAYPGVNTLIVEANPNGDQPELYHPNNFGYFSFYTKIDSINPVLDVTFDGVHILDRDIVSAKPFIKIMLKDENSVMPLNDTSLLKVQLLRPGSTTPEDVPVDGDIAKFNPSTSSEKNEASIDYTPTLSEDGLYKLIVSGKDHSSNTAGSASTYEIQFTVENKPSVTNLLNYPNPFSTSTAFVFTLTGSQIPEQFKIQILTVTGKVIREITKQELGPIHIGRNITEYKWDGRDQYGQLLGNGVYIYRLVTQLNGNKVEHRENQAIDQYFNKSGYGKMYIMR